LCGAEKSGHGDEEGWHQGADYVDCVPGRSIHYSLRFGVLDIATRAPEASVSPICGICFCVMCGETSVYELRILYKSGFFSCNCAISNVIELGRTVRALRHAQRR